MQSKQVCLVANGDLRLSANQKCWPEQAKMEAVLTKALKAEGWKVVRAHPDDAQKKHGFIDSQKDNQPKIRTTSPRLFPKCVKPGNKMSERCFETQVSGGVAWWGYGRAGTSSYRSGRKAPGLTPVARLKI